MRSLNLKAFEVLAEEAAVFARDRELEGFCAIYRHDEARLDLYLLVPDEPG
jgi:hypothetical protein